MPSYYLINSFQCPNFVDELCRLLSGTEFKLFHVTFRQTIADIKQRGLAIKERKAGISYSTYRKLSGLCNATIARDLRELVKYKVILPIPGSIHPQKGQEYFLNVVVEVSKKRGKDTQVLLSPRLMDMPGLRERRKRTVQKNSRKTANARAAKAAKRATKKALQENMTSSVAQREKPSVEQRTERSVAQRGKLSVEQRDREPSATHCETPSRTHPHYTPIDLETGQQKPVRACVHDHDQTTIFEYLERKLKKDQRVQENPPRQPYPLIFQEVMELRQINCWELQQLINGILADATIKSPLAALRCPDMFSTDYYIHFIAKQKTPGTVTVIRQANAWKKQDVWQIDAIWKTTQKVLQDRINRPSYNTWIHPISLVAIEQDTATLSVPDDTFLYWIGEYYTTVIGETLQELLGFQPTLRIMVAEAGNTKQEGGGREGIST